MPFVMTHLYIAYDIINTTSQIKNPSDFLLGAIAPDAVHFRKSYESDMKKASHLCVGEERWGWISNNEEWTENVFAFLDRNSSNANTDFIHGYCSHILADIQNNIKIWTPFKDSEQDALKDGMGSTLYHKEAKAVDYLLFLRDQRRKTIWSLLKKASGHDIENVAFKVEIEAMRDSILNEQYDNRPIADDSEHRYNTLSGMIQFIEEESKYIKELLYAERRG